MSQDSSSSSLFKDVRVTKWLGLGLPFRPARQRHSFAWFDGTQLPEVDTSEFKHIQTLGDVITNREKLQTEIGSPMGCTIFNAFDANEKENKELPDGYRRFYGDSSHGVSWAYDENSGAVFAFLDEKVQASLACVAQTLTEFCARQKIEAEIYVRSSDHRDLFLLSSSVSGSPAFEQEVNKLDLEHVWQEVIVRQFSVKLIDYLRPFYLQFCQSRLNRPPLTSSSLLQHYMDRGQRLNATTIGDEKKTINASETKIKLSSETTFFGLPASLLVIGTMIATTAVGLLKSR